MIGAGNLRLQADHIQSFTVHQIGLGEHCNAAAHGEQAANVEVLASLRLDGFIGGNHQQDQVNSAHAGQHVAHEALVAGNVHETQAQGVAVAERANQDARSQYR